LEEKIKEQEEEIKDERTVIIYQMGELAVYFCLCRKLWLVKLMFLRILKVKRDLFLGDG
jgi:hypothetical protein